MATPRSTRPISWVRAALKEFETFPEGARSICLAALTIAAEGSKADIAKPMKGMGVGHLRDCPAVSRRRVSRDLCHTAWRGPLGRPCISEEIDARPQDAPARGGFDQGPVEKIEGDVAMKGERLE